MTSNSPPDVDCRRPTPIRRLSLFVGTLLLMIFVIAAADPAPGPGPHPLVWDAMEKSIDAKASETSATFKFTVRNTADHQVEIFEIRASCGCTVAEMPSRPWILAPGASGAFSATTDFQGKQGEFTKSLFVISSAGSQRLGVTVHIPESADNRRTLNQQLAYFDRQSVFRGECASCHAAPAAGRHGEELFQVACAICHLASPRASMVPDLASPRSPRDAAFWEKWISEGKPQTLMPAFAEKNGGPLSPDQVASLVEYALARFPGKVEAGK